jgi:nicotinate-nucleotide pyrophosphorylase (carboxylating)
MWENLRANPSAPLSKVLPALRQLVREAVREDVGTGDVSAAIFEPGRRGTAVFLAKQDGVVSGIDVARLVFEEVDPACRFKVLLRNGARFAKRSALAEVRGPLASLLTAERTALNFVQQLSGVATLTAAFVEAIGNGGPGIYDTRKTVPLLRWLQKRAVLHGGGRNHRFGLDDMAMLKNNHIDAAGGVAAAVSLLRAKPRTRTIPLCVEARDLKEATEALRERAKIIMLDNMSPGEMRRAAAVLRGEAASLRIPMPQIEISGGVSLKNIGKLRGLPMDRISIGALTHSAPAIDISLRIMPSRRSHRRATM